MTTYLTESATQLPSASGKRSSGLARIAVAAGVVAVLDISFAATYWVVIRGATTLPRLLQSIATGVLGKAAFHGGSASVWLGALLHCLVAAGWTAIFFVAVNRSPALRRALNRKDGAAKTGMPFGVVVWLTMSFVVVPLSHASATSVMSAWFWICLAWHAVGVGYPIALFARSGEP